MALVDFLKDQGLIDSFSVVDQSINLRLRPFAFSEIQQISKSGRRQYIKAQNLKSLPYGVHIVSTPLGLLDSGQAKDLGVGGEILCRIR